MASGSRAARLALIAILICTVGPVAGSEEEAPFRLLDAHGKIVPRARVTVGGTTGGVLTDTAGLFRLSPVPVLPFELMVFGESGDWLGRIRVTAIPDGSPRDLNLPALDRVEVTVPGGAAPATLAPPAAAATVISRRDREERQPERLTDVLDQVPGAGKIGSGHPVVPSLRGLARGRTLLLIDDARVTTERRAGPSATYLNPFSVESMEIVRGPGSVSYGSDALGGILHARTTAPRAGERWFRYQFGAGTGDDAAIGGVEANLPVGSGAILVQAQQRSYGEYRAPGGTIVNSGARDRGFLVKGLVPIGRVRWIFGAQVGEAFDVGKPSVDSATDPTRYPEEKSYRFTAGALFPDWRGFTDSELHLFAGSYRLVTDRERLPRGSVTRLVERADVEARDASIRFVTTRPVSNGLLRFGLDASSRLNLEATGTLTEYDTSDRVASETDDRSIEDADRYDAALFAEAERSFAGGRTTLSGGLRAQGIRTENHDGLFGDRSTSEGNASGYLAGSARAGRNWTLTLQAARGFRDPFLSDRYFAGITGRGFIVGNPELDPETSLQFDFSARRAGERVRLAGYLYHYTIDDLIERFETAPSEFAFRNRGEVEILGAEAEVEIRLSEKLSTRIALNTARGEVTEDESAPDDVPGPRLTLSIHHRPLERLWWRLGLLVAGEDDRPGPNELRTPGHALLDLSAGIDIREALRVSLVLSNVLDRDYPASPDQDEVQAAGFQALLLVGGRL